MVCILLRFLGLVLSIAACKATTSQNFDRRSAARAVGFSGSAYCVGTLGHGVADWSCASCKQLGPCNATEFHDTGVFETNQNSFVAWDPFEGPNGSVVVAFTGTDPLSLENYLDDFNFAPVDFPFCKGCLVHHGFLKNWRNVQDKVLALVESYMAAHPGSQVRVIGHSLGAAVALLCSLHLQSQGVASVVALHTFGEPRIGNSALAAFSQNQLGGRHWRLTHRRDPIPHLPPKGLLGAIHTGTEVFFGGESNGTMVVCDGAEDHSCSDQYAADVVLTDHLFYLGFDFITNYLGCKL